MRFNLILITIIIIGVSCSQKEAPKIKSHSKNKRLKKAAFNPENPFLVNMLTGDSIFNVNEDSILYGVPYSMDTSEILNETLLPKKYTIPDSMIKKAEAFPHISELPGFQKIATLGTPKINSIEEGHGQALRLVNELGDTIKSGLEFALNPVSHDMLFPQPIEALAPRYKGNDIDGFTYLDVEQGLPYSYTIGLAFDSLNNLWTGTSGGGLVKYDGKTFIQLNKKSGIPDEQIYDVLIDKESRIWLASIDKGLILFDGHSFLSFPEIPAIEGWCLQEAQDGTIWLGTNGFGIFEIKSKEGKFYCEHYSTEQGLAGNVIRDIDEDSAGKIIISTFRNGFSVFDGKSFYNYGEQQGLPTNALFDLALGSDGAYYFATFGKGIVKVSNDSISQLNRDQGLCSDYLLSVFISSNGDLWAGSLDNGLSLISKKSLKNYNEDNGLAYNIINDFAEDNYGNVWIGTDGGGIAIYQKGSFKIMTEDQGLANRFVQSITNFKESDLLFGLDLGISILSEEITNYQLGYLLNLNSILSATYDSLSGRLFLGSSSGKILCLKNKELQEYSLSDRVLNIWDVVSVDSNYLIIISEEMGLQILEDKNLKSFTKNTGLVTLEFLDLYREGKVFWLATNALGLIKIDFNSNPPDITNYSIAQGLSNTTIFEIKGDSRGNKWLGIHGGGLNRISKNEDSVLYISSSDGLKDDKIWSLALQNDSVLWVGCNSGLSKVELTGKKLDRIKAISNYDKRDGLKGIDFFKGSALIDKNNRAWWGTGKGLVYKDLENNEHDTTTPVVYLDQIQLDGRKVDFRFPKDSAFEDVEYDSVLPYRNVPLNLSLPFDKNQLTFQFAGVDWKASHKVHFSVMLSGLDAKWRDQGNRNFATFRTLEPGDYVFKVKAAGDNGIWSNTFEYPFEIRPPWYETKAYYIGQTIFLGLLLFFAVFLNRSGKGGEWIIVFTFVAVITIFEFVLVLVEPYIDQYSSGIPIIKVVVNVMIALSLNPAEKFIRERIRRRNKTQ